MHLLVDLWGASNLWIRTISIMRYVMRRRLPGVTILHGHFHHFSPNGGVSGVLVLAENDISIHTWPERDFAAIDIFMRGSCNPDDGVPALETAFKPREVNLDEQRRGLIA